MPEIGIGCTLSSTLDLSKIQDVLKKCNVEIQVGWPAGRPHVNATHKTKNGKRKGGADVSGIESSELAEWLHRGTANIPARPFFDDAVIANKDDIKAMCEKQVSAAERGGQPNWHQVGTYLIGAVQEYVRSDAYKSSAPNSPETIARKGSDTPLIDGGDLVNSLAYNVEKK